MASAWSRISSNVIAHPPEAEAACRRRCGNGKSRPGACIPHTVDKRKQEVGACVTERALVQTSTTQDPHDTKECTMSPTQRDAKKQAKARKRRYLKAQERLER